MRDTLAVAGAVIVVLSCVPYIIDLVKKKTRPNIVSWFTWALLITIGAFAALAAHQTRTAIITFGDAASVCAILLLGFKYGYAKFSLFDGICQVGAVVGLILWLVFNSPTTAIIATVSIDFIAALPTFKHAWLKPDEETWQTYFISSLGAAVGLTSLSVFTIASLAYPVYLLLIGLTISATVIISRKKKKLSLSQPS